MEDAKINKKLWYFLPLLRNISDDITLVAGAGAKIRAKVELRNTGKNARKLIIIIILFKL